MSRLRRSVAAIRRNDPAAWTTLEILLTYPGLHTLFWHRLSHLLYRRQLFLLTKIHAQFWCSIAGVEIHPGATIGEGVFIDYDMDIMIGEIAEIEGDVVLFHGMTLGGTGCDTGECHPTAKKGAMTPARAQTLGPVMIGERSKIRAGAVIISDIPVDATTVGVSVKVVRLNGKKVEKEHD